MAELKTNTKIGTTTIAQGSAVTVELPSVAGTLITDTDLQALHTLTKGPTGFTNNTNITVTYDSITRTIMLTGTFEAYYQGIKLPELTNGWTSAAHPDVANNYFLYYNGAAFVWTTTPWTFDMLMISYVQYNSHKLAIREVHGFMDYETHIEFHLNIGSYKLSGGDFSNYTLASLTDTERRPHISSTVVNDEDLSSVIPALTTNSYTHRYLTDAAIRSFTTAQSDIISHAGSRPFWNENIGGTWQQTQFANNDYGAIFVVALPATADNGSQLYRYLFVQPQQISSDLNIIQNLTPMNLIHGESNTLVSEFVFIGKIIVKATSTSWTIEDVSPLAGTRVSQVALPSNNYLTIVSTDASLTGNGTPTNPLSAASFAIAMAIALG